MDSLLNKVAYITGTSRGIGKALAEKLMANDFHVIGMSRTNNISNPNFIHKSLDLADLNAVNAFRFDTMASEIMLINNAGLIGEIQPVGNLPNNTIEAVTTVNVIAPQILMNNFINQCANKVQKGHIINVSSGAGKRPIDAWAAYCSSKAALDLFSETIQEEWRLREIDNWYIHSIAPGVVDTEMQNNIRSAEPGAFKDLEKFTALKANNELASPNTVADLFYKVVDSPQDFKEVVISVRNF